MRYWESLKRDEAAAPINFAEKYQIHFSCLKEPVLSAAILDCRSTRGLAQGKREVQPNRARRSASGGAGGYCWWFFWLILLVRSPLPFRGYANSQEYHPSHITFA